VRATIVEMLPQGGLLLSLLGQKLHAASNVQLEAGRTYDFVVTATTPTLTLTTAGPLTVPTFSGSATAGMLGASSADVTRILTEALPLLPRSHASEGESARAWKPADLGGILQRLANGTASAADLRALGRSLGHDQEARVLRLPPQAKTSAAGEVRLLRQTNKAMALEFVAEQQARVDPSTRDPAARGAAQALIEGFSLIEMDNAVRADQGTAQWLPLLASGNDFLRDARMFLMPPPEQGDGPAGDEAASGEATFRVVLLLDLTRLGQLRIDVEVRDDSVAATFQIQQPAVLPRLDGAADELRKRLEGEGLEVRYLKMQLAPGGDLPVADLVRVPTSRDPEALVDVHA